jgi:hypothetical protein
MTTVDPVTQRLETLVQISPDLKDAAQVYAALLPLLREQDLHISPISMTVEQAREKLQAGLPLLHNLDLELDYAAAGVLMAQMARGLEAPDGEARPAKRGWRRPHDQEPDRLALYEHARAGDTAKLRAAAARQIRVALEQGRLDPSVLLPHVAGGEGEYVTALAESLQLDPGLVWTLAQNALKPALYAWCCQLSPLTEGVDWRRGYCPICGSAATLAELRGNDQSKHLRCALCGADWPFPQLQCMYCGNEDHSTLSYFYPDGEREKQRIEVCDKCGGYLKVIAAFSPIPVQVLPIEDLATLHLDYIAQERGYARVQVR